MPTLAGAVSISALPPNKGLIVDLCFFEVDGPDSAAPHDGDPPTDAVTDCTTVFHHVDLDADEIDASEFEHAFVIQRPKGYYFVQLRATLFRSHNGEMAAQAEQFFFTQRPLHISSESEGYVTFPVSWPPLGVDQLHYHGTVEPQSKRPWWQFW